MEVYKKRVHQRFVLCIAMVLLCIALGVFCALNQEMVAEEVAGFQLGIISGLGVLACLQLVSLRMALFDDQKLRLLYNKEHDERLQAIRSKAGMPMLLVTSVLILMAAIVAGYLNVIVFYTLVVAASLQLMLGAGVKIYYRKTM